jgi:flagellar basal body P-ring formation protein FlgA
MRRFVLFAFALVLCWPGFAEAAPRIVVPNRDIARGEKIDQADLMLQPATNAVQPGTATRTADIAGMEARRLLHAGESIRLSDVRHPILVTKGAIVTMTFDDDGISLTASARAIGSGGIGETITVQNPVSFRQIGAVVTGPGMVRAIGNSLTIATRTDMSGQ